MYSDKSATTRRLLAAMVSISVADARTVVCTSCVMLLASKPSGVLIKAIFVAPMTRVFLLRILMVTVAVSSPETFFASFGILISNDKTALFSVAPRSTFPRTIVFTLSSTVASPASVMEAGSMSTLASAPVAPPPSMKLTVSGTSLYFTTSSSTSIESTSVVRSLISTAFPSASTSV